MQNIIVNYHSKTGINLWIQIEDEEIIKIEFGEVKEILGDDSGIKFVYKVKKQLNEYFLGERKTFDLRIRISGTDFQKKVWVEIAKVPYGEVTSYAQIAQKLGVAGGARAVGNACGSNKIPVIIPCHRVLTKDGKLGGFGGGIELKRKLLEMEKFFYKLN